MDAVGHAGVAAADEFSVIEAAPIKELTEAQQVAALSQGLGLNDPEINDGRGLNGFGDADDAGAPARAGASTHAPTHAPQPGRIDTAETEIFRNETRELGQMGVEIKGGAKPLGNQAVAQAIQAQGVVFGPGGLKASNVIPLVGRGDRKPEDRPTSQVRTLADKKQAAVDAVGNLGARTAEYHGIPTTREELEAAKAQLDRDYELQMAKLEEDARRRQEMETADKFAPAYPVHPGEDKAEAAFTLTQGQINTIQRILDMPIPDARALVAAVALKASVEVAGGDGLTISFTSAELAEIDRRASFWSMSRAQALNKMFEQVKPALFDGSSMV